MRLSEEDKGYMRGEIKQQIDSFFNNEQSALISHAVENAVAAAIKPLMLQIEGLKNALEDTKQIHKAEIATKNERIAALESTIIAQNKRNCEFKSFMLEKDDQNEQYGRKDSLRITGIPFAKDIDNDALQTKVIDALSQNGVEIEDCDIHRLHRSSKHQLMSDYKGFLNKSFDTRLEITEEDKTVETAEVIVRFTRWDPRMRVYSLHYKKTLTIWVECDLTKYRQDALRLSRQYLKDHELSAYV